MKTKCEIFVEELATAIRQFKSSASVTLTMPEKRIMEAAYLELGGKPFDLNCQPCCTEVFNRAVQLTTPLQNKLAKGIVAKPVVKVEAKKVDPLEAKKKQAERLVVDMTFTVQYMKDILKENKIAIPANPTKKVLVEMVNKLQLCQQTIN